MKKKLYLGVTIILLTIVLLIAFFATGKNNYKEINNFRGDMTIFKSNSCGCCGIYGKYFKDKGNKNIKISTLEDIGPIKDKYNIPNELRSCHTIVLGNYYIEGHVPLEAIEKLLKDKPNIAGLAMGGMEGMPSGSPGMPGSKEGDFIIYAIKKDGTYGEFMRL